MDSESNSSGHTKRRGCSASPFCKCRYVSKYIGRIVRFGAFLPCKRQHRAVQTADFCSNILGGRGLACAQPIGDETDRPGQDVGEQALRFAAWQGRRRALETASALSAELGEGFTVLTLQENKSVATAESYCEKVSVIAAVFPVFFILVAALVVMTTMPRMIEEERAIIGCLRSLGAGDGKILFKYLFMAAVCCLVAAALGVGLGCALVQCVLVYLDFGSLADVQWYSYLASFFLVLLFAGVTDLLLSSKILRIDMAESLKANE